MATVTASGREVSNGSPVVAASVTLWDPSVSGPKAYNDPLPGGSPTYGPETTDAAGDWSTPVDAGLYWVATDDGSTITWKLTSFEPVATTLTTSGGSGGSGGTWSGLLPLDFGDATNHSDLIYLFHSGANIYGFGIDDSTMVLFAPNAGGHWDFRRATGTPSGWNGTPVARVDDSGNVLANGGTSSNPGHAFLSETGLGFYRQASGVIGATGHLRPHANATDDLGSTSLRWNALWAGAATLASAAIAGALSAGATTLGATTATSIEAPIGTITRNVGGFTSVVANTTINAGTALQLGGADINTGGGSPTLSNVAYLDRANAFTNNQTVTKTTEQLRVRYDASNYLAVTVGSGGDTALALKNSSATATLTGIWVATSIQNTPIGTTTRAAGAFTTVDANSTLANDGNAAFNRSSGNTNVGAALGTGGGKLNVWDAAEQLRLNYNASKYVSFVVDSSGNLTVTPVGNVISPGTSTSIRTASFTSGLLGWSVNWDGTAEFNNVNVRGEIKASVFKIAELAATAGTLGVFFSAAALYEDVATPASTGTSYTLKAKNSDAGGMLLAVGDFCRMKTWTGSGISDAWFEVTARTNNTTYTTYTVTSRGSTGFSVTFRAGTAVADYGPSGTGFITQSADGTVGSSPNLTMATHSGTPWSGFTTLLRAGNLNGSYAYVSNTYGVGIGQYGTAGQPWITVDTTNGIRIGNNTTVVGQWDTSGNIIVGQVASGVPNVRVNATAVALRLNTTNYVTLDSNAGTPYIQVGLTGASQNNVLIQSGAVSVRNNTTERIGLTAAGVLTVKDSGGNAVFTFDASAGAEFTKPLTIGTSGGIWQGSSGTFASPTTGLKVYNSSGDGVADLWSGGTNVLKLNPSGMTLRANNSTGGSYVQWSDGSRNVGKVEMSAGGGFNPTISLSARQVDATYPEAYSGLIAETRDATYRYNVGAFVNSYGGAGTAYDAFDIGNAARIALVGGAVTARPTYVRLSVGSSGALMVGSSFNSSSTPTSGYKLDVRGAAIAQDNYAVWPTTGGAYEFAHYDFARADGSFMGWFLCQRNASGNDTITRCTVADAAGSPRDVWYARDVGGVGQLSVQNRVIVQGTGSSGGTNAQLDLFRDDNVVYHGFLAGGSGGVAMYYHYNGVIPANQWYVYNDGSMAAKSYATTSTRASKQRFRPVDHGDTLRRLAGLAPKLQTFDWTDDRPDDLRFERKPSTRVTDPATGQERVVPGDPDRTRPIPRREETHLNFTAEDWAEAFPEQTNPAGAIHLHNQIGTLASGLLGLAGEVAAMKAQFAALAAAGNPRPGQTR